MPIPPYFLQNYELERTSWTLSGEQYRRACEIAEQRLEERKRTPEYQARKAPREKAKRHQCLDLSKFFIPSRPYSETHKSK